MNIILIILVILYIIAWAVENMVSFVLVLLFIVGSVSIAYFFSMRKEQEEKAEQVRLQRVYEEELIRIQKEEEYRLQIARQEAAQSICNLLSQIVYVEQNSQLYKKAKQQYNYYNARFKPLPYPSLQTRYIRYNSLKMFSNHTVWEEYNKACNELSILYQDNDDTCKSNLRLMTTYTKKRKELLSKSELSIGNMGICPESHMKIEAKLINNLEIEPITSYSVYVHCSYTSPAGKNNYQDKNSFLREFENNE